VGVQIIPVPAASARAVWPIAEPHILKALEHARGCYLPEDVLDIVEHGKAQLWMCQRDDGLVVASLVSWIASYPRRKSICVPFIGGTEMRTWFRKALLAIESWGIEQGCDALEGGARRGWARMAKMDESAVVLWKDIGARAQEQKAA
jgi:hypothetical protein